MKAAGVILMAPDGSMLFLKRGPSSDFPGTWCLPAGRVEEGESSEEAARRECVEETGHRIQGEMVLFDEKGEFTTFLANVPDQFVPHDVTEEHIGFAWAFPNKPPYPMHPGLEDTLNGEKMDEEARFTYHPGDLEVFSPTGEPLEEPAMEEEEVDEAEGEVIHIYETAE